MIISKRCMITGKVTERDLPITMEQYDDWVGGTLIQKAMPHLSAADREFLMTGITEETWDEVIAGDPGEGMDL